MAWTSGADDELLHGSTSYLSMLHDKGRNAAYDAALRAVGRAPELVLDLGAGTGLLAALACQAHPSCRAVACEVYERCAHVAGLVLKENGLQERVKVVNKVASDLEVGEDLPRKADLCIFELFDSQLLGESILPILRDAQAQRVTGARLTVTSGPALLAADVPELRGAAWPLMLGQLGLGEGRWVFTQLSNAWEAFDIDFAHLPSTPQARATQVKVHSGGEAHAVAWWWELDLGGASHSSWTEAATAADASQAARHHWRPCLSFLPGRAVEGRSEVSITAAFDEEGVWFAWGEGCPPRWLEGVTHIPPERERLLLAAPGGAFRRGLRALAELASWSPEPVLLLPAEDLLCLDTFAQVLEAREGSEGPKPWHGCGAPTDGLQASMRWILLRWRVVLPRC
ncbi:unnamed protein product [Durusdinium trenchii]|uniref:Protein arginine N-methyltransferase 7 n=1 Tax=Durusdinium trenchii TaxID=1381693 RepID=A0ABP0KTZ6_9DINO